MTEAAAVFDRAILAVRWNSLVRGERQLCAVRPLLETFVDCGIPVIVLKGAAFVHTLYADAGLRPFSDIDLLIQKQDLGRACQVLESLGYRPEDAQVNAEEREQDCQTNYVLPEAMEDGAPLVVEIHWNLINNDRLLHAASQLRIERFWRASEPATIAGVAVRVLGPEHTLIHLCLHLFGHGLDAPLSLRDMAALLESDSRWGRIDWRRLIQEARSVGCAGGLYAGLRLVRKTRGSAIPEEVLTQLRPRSWRCRRLDRAIDIVASGRSIGEAQAGFLLPLFWDRPQSAFRTVVATLFPPKRWLKQHYAPHHVSRPRHLMRLLVMLTRQMYVKTSKNNRDV